MRMNRGPTDPGGGYLDSPAGNLPGTPVGVPVDDDPVSRNEVSLLCLGATGAEEPEAGSRECNEQVGTTGVRLGVSWCRPSFRWPESGSRPGRCGSRHEKDRAFHSRDGSGPRSEITPGASPAGNRVIREPAVGGVQPAAQLQKFQVK